MAKKSKGKVDVEKELKTLKAKEKELERKLENRLDEGREMVEEETEEFKKKVRLHPLEYVAGAFIIGLVLGKLTK